MEVVARCTRACGERGRRSARSGSTRWFTPLAETVGGATPPPLRVRLQSGDLARSRVCSARVCAAVRDGRRGSRVRRSRYSGAVRCFKILLQCAHAQMCAQAVADRLSADIGREVTHLCS